MTTFLMKSGFTLRTWYESDSSLLCSNEIPHTAPREIR